MDKIMEKTNTELFDQAVTFATRAHAGSMRKGRNYPYILHPMEAATIAATITKDQEILAAALLHDVVEDTDVTIEEIEAAFGARVAEYVSIDTAKEIHEENPIKRWQMRRQQQVDAITSASREAKIVAMGDKLSNMRAIHRDYLAEGEDFWNIFHVKDKSLHAWYYRSLAAALSDLKDTRAYQEFVTLIEATFN